MGRHIAKAFKEARIEAGLSQWDVAKELGYGTPQFISNIERGISTIPMDKLTDISKLFGRRPVAFFEAFREDLIEEMYAKLKETKRRLKGTI